MNSIQSTIRTLREKSHPRPDLAEIELALSLFNGDDLVDSLERFPRRGRPGHPRSPLVNAHLVGYLLNVGSTNDLIRRLQESSELRQVCGFGDDLPSRPTFTRTFSRLAEQRDLIEDIQAGVVGRIAKLIPGFGEKVSVDSTVVPTNSNPNRKTISDPEASWTAKNSARAKDGKEFFWGYKLHAVADAETDIPIGGFVTTASRHDSPVFPALLQHVEGQHPWLDPDYVMADKGYDSTENYWGGPRTERRPCHLYVVNASQVGQSEGQRGGRVGCHLVSTDYCGCCAVSE